MRKAGRLRAHFKARREKNRASEQKAGAVVVRVSPLMLVMATVFVAFGMAYEFACSLTAVALHEFAHAKTAKKLGYALNEIKLMPYGAALCGAEDIRPKHEVMIAMAGPALNLVLGMIFAAMWWLVPSSYLFTETFCVCNIYIGLFNLLPVYPMDGGRILFALLSAKLKRRSAYVVCRVISAAFGVCALALFGLSAAYAPNICFLTVGIFMVASAFIPDNRARYYALFAKGGRRARLDKTLEKRVFAVSTETTVTDMCRTLDPDRFTQFDVYDGDKLVSSLSEAQLVEMIKKHGYEHNIGQMLKET